MEKYNTISKLPNSMPTTTNKNVKLIHQISQNNKFGFHESTLHIEVSYNPTTRTVERIRDIYTSNDKGECATILCIMIEHFEEQLNAMVDSINWPEVYSDLKTSYETTDNLPF